MNATSPKSSMAKLKLKKLKIIVLGCVGVGKTAMIVRFITNRFIGEYDSNLEKIYTAFLTVDNEIVQFEILDAQHPNEAYLSLETNIRWADGFVLLYSVTDKCSFDECNRLKFLINYNKRRRKLGSNYKDGILDVPVVLVGNKTDNFGDRMVTFEEGKKRSREISCVSFHEISVRESVDQVHHVFLDVCRFWRVLNKCPKLKRSTSDVQNGSEICSFYELNMRSRFWHPSDFNECEENDSTSSELESPPFRGRASTDGTLLSWSRPRRWRYPPPGLIISNPRVERRMSISLRGSNASY